MANNKNQEEKIRALIEKLNNSNINNESGNIDELRQEILKSLHQTKRYSRALDVLFFSSMALLVFFVLFFINSNEKSSLYEQNITEKEAIINRLGRSDSLLGIYMNVDSSGSFISRIKNDQPLTYNDLIYEVDSLRDITRKQQIKLNLIYENYHIIATQKDIIKNGKKYINTKVESEKIDSAFFLLDIFKNDIVYNKNDDSYMLDHYSAYKTLKSKYNLDK